MHSQDDNSRKTPAETIDRILELFAERGVARYGGEDVSQTEHALQAAFAAEKENAGDELIASALLHDLGHLVHNLEDDCADHGIDDKHEELAYRWLQRAFGPNVTEPIRLHVAAKRYLCTTDREYYDQLSAASKTSLRLQGGAMNEAEVKEFEANPHFKSALRVRYWDDIAKVKGLKTPDLGHYRVALDRSAARVVSPPTA